MRGRRVLSRDIGGFFVIFIILCYNLDQFLKTQKAQSMLVMVFKPVEVSPDLSLIIFITTLIILMVVMVILYIKNLVKVFKEREITLERVKLSREWHKNGKDISNWLKAHCDDLNKNFKATIFHTEFQELLWKDFKIYERLIILDPKLKEDPKLNIGREFYKFLIRTENQKPS